MFVKEVQVTRGALSSRIDVFFLQLTGLQSLIDLCHADELTISQECILDNAPVMLGKIHELKRRFAGKVSFILIKGHDKLH